MKTYVLIAGDFTTWGGMDRANYELAWHLAERADCRVHLVAHYVAQPLREHRNAIFHAVPRPFGRHTLGAPLLAMAGKTIARQLTEQGARVIVNGGNCNWADVNWIHAVHAAWDCQLAHRPILSRARAAIVKHHSRTMEQRCAANARVVLTNSHKAQEHIVQAAPRIRDRVCAVYYGTDPNVFCPANADRRRIARQKSGLDLARPIVVFIGALGHDRNKGFDVLFSAWDMLCCDKDWDADLVVAGGGAEREYWCRRAIAAGLERRIRFLGMIRNVPDLLAASDALVSPTHYDAYGLAVHEALCCGVAAFVTRCAGVAERYPENLTELLLDDPPDPVNVANRLQRWRSDIAGCSTRVRDFGELLRRRTWQNMAEDIVDLIETDMGAA